MFYKLKQAVRSALHAFGADLVQSSSSWAAIYRARSKSHLLLALGLAFPRLHGLRFIQIGSNDGRRADPIHNLIDEFVWSGIFVEPHPEMMRRLKSHRSGSRFQFIDKAIAAETGVQTFYTLEGENLPPMVDALSTLSRQRIEECVEFFRSHNPRIAENEVACMGVSDLLSIYGKDWDVCVIDVEGLDGEIVRLLADHDGLARVVHFEHKCLSEEDRAASFRLLLDKGYNFLVSEDDCTAYRRG